MRMLLSVPPICLCSIPYDHSAATSDASLQENFDYEVDRPNQRQQYPRCLSSSSLEVHRMGREHEPDFLDCLLASRTANLQGIQKEL